ncbi:hypothetical protein DQ226_16810 [Dietzia maris]|uniref:Na+/H+ antiporter MnhB subunit-related protein domain-containing protein n=1 Tax=Dietzia maris TaxID=37915 RepID=A0A365P6Y7_9ACTN|nr:hypothetical protein DQ226_16810 [Dietzia maris]
MGPGDGQFDPPARRRARERDRRRVAPRGRGGRAGTVRHALAPVGRGAAVGRRDRRDHPDLRPRRARRRTDPAAGRGAHDHHVRARPEAVAPRLHHRLPPEEHRRHRAGRPHRHHNHHRCAGLHRAPGTLPDRRVPAGERPRDHRREQHRQHDPRGVPRSRHLRRGGRARRGRHRDPRRPRLVRATAQTMDPESVRETLPGSAKSTGTAAEALEDAARNTVPLKLLARGVTPVLAVVSVMLLWRGHNEPGGGFIAALVAACAFALVYLARESDRPVSRPSTPVALIGGGLVVAGLTGIGGYALGQFLQPANGYFLGQRLSSALIFDLGVYAGVLGLVMTAFNTLGAGRAPAEVVSGPDAPDTGRRKSGPRKTSGGAGTGVTGGTPGTRRGTDEEVAR